MSGRLYKGLRRDDHGTRDWGRFQCRIDDFLGIHPELWVPNREKG